MSTTKVAILAMAQLMCFNKADTDEIDRLFTEVMLEFSHDPRMWTHTFVNATVTSNKDHFTSLTNTYHLSALFYNGRQLREVRQNELQAYEREWRDKVGTPVAYTLAGEQDRVVRYFPARDDGTATVTILGVVAATGNIPDVLELPLALKILEREFSRESPHRDLPFATACGGIADKILKLVE